MKKFFLVLFFWVLTSNSAQAATISFTTADEVVVDEELAIQMMVETDGENINALEGEIVWPAGKLDLIAVNDDFSIISLWIRDPTLLVTTTAGRLPFAGLIPSGYGEPSGQILTLVFRPRLADEATITSKEILVLLNDGKGTPARTITKQFDLTIQSNRILPPVWLYVLFLIVGIIIAILIWWTIRRRKFLAI